MAGPGMTGGGKLDDYLSGVAKRLGSPQEVRTGFLEGSTESDGTSTPLIAAINEFGAPAAGIPPRPFFRGMITQHQSEWGAQLGKVLVTQDYDAGVSLGLMGELIGGELVQSIKDLTSPPLAQSTIDRKGFDKPLINTGDMWKSVNHEVREAE
jgi:hypothetical protein